MAGYKKGELILSSKPYVYILNNVERGKRCDYCFESNSSLKRCSQCAFAYFCGKQCQSEGWHQHKEECRFIKKVQPKEPTPSLRLLMLLIMKTKRYGYREPHETAGVYSRCFADLESHIKEINQDIRTCQQMIAFIGTLKEYIGNENIPPADKFSEIFGKMVINTFSIWDPDMESIGSGLYLGASIFDHSCEPNAEVVFIGTTLTVRAVCDIPSKDLRKVRISYIDQMQLTEERQKHLGEQYYFVCDCPRCTDPKLNELMTSTANGTDFSDEKVAAPKKVVGKLNQMKKQKEKPSTIFEVAMDALVIADAVLRDTNIYRLKLVEHAFEACISLKRWADAVPLGREMIHPYQLFYGPTHPYCCLLLTKLGKMELLLHQNKEAKAHLLMAEEATRISHGCDHPLYLKISILLAQCQHELSMNA